MISFIFFKRPSIGSLFIGVVIQNVKRNVNVITGDAICSCMGMYFKRAHRFFYKPYLAIGLVMTMRIDPISKNLFCL
jgi:hypothetical protein